MDDLLFKAPPERMTKECERYYLASRQSALFLFNTLTFYKTLDGFLETIGAAGGLLRAFAATNLDDPQSPEKEELRRKIAEALEGVDKIEARDDGQGFLKGFAQRKLFEDLPMLCEMLACRHVDNYLSYISEILTLIYRDRPERLRSNEQVTHEWVLKHNTMDELIAALVEKTVLNLSFNGMYDLWRDIKKKLNFNLFETEDEYKFATEIVEIRNLVVHNRGIVNRVFLSRSRNSKLELGHKIALGTGDLKNYSKVLSSSVYDIDLRVTQQFGLAQPVLRNSLPGYQKNDVVQQPN
ncbi:MAG TPA: hypothetical protein VFC63_12710 [Blastocatellia bacterium]|nr:hypothetical protein [Blastocatellia bacterium]